MAIAKTLADYHNSSCLASKVLAALKADGSSALVLYAAFCCGSVPQLGKGSRLSGEYRT
jgi:hypothetical protein